MTAGSFVASAATINVDFNVTNGGAATTYSGTAAAPDAGTVWNGFTIGTKSSPVTGTLTSAALNTSTGSPTGVTVTTGSYLSYLADENPAGFATTLFTDFAYQQVLGPGGPNSTFSINHLNPLSSYDIYVYAQNGGYSNTASTFTVGGITKIANNDLGPGGSFVENTNYVRFTGVVPDGSGVISGTFNDFEPANNAAFNGIQIVEIPEPAGLSLGGLTGLLLLRRRRS